ncbi:MAG: hypothetical protein B0A82_03005 [Alkalinema sp. CACIAM 70d]|nr:MAG: hypothetical protein B0A82_03005 [Alkalinema sp. CACIAM 70d]
MAIASTFCENCRSRLNSANNGIVFADISNNIMEESTVYRSLKREAQEEKSREIALNFLREGMSVDLVARGTGLSIEAVQHLQEELNQTPQA